MYEKTYNTIRQIYQRIAETGGKTYLMGGISAAIQTGKELYRENADLDVMVNVEDLDRVIEILTAKGYDVQDKRGIRTRKFCR